MERSWLRWVKAFRNTRVGERGQGDMKEGYAKEETRKAETRKA